MKTTYIGYDLGDGETCISIYGMQDNRMEIKQAKMPYEAEGSAMPTLLAVNAAGNVLIGSSAISRRFELDTKELYVNFKMRPTELDAGGLERFRQSVTLFTEALFRDCDTIKCLFGYDLGHQNEQFVVTIGYPTTWSEEDVAIYKSIFEQVECFANPTHYFNRDDISVDLTVEPESDAALMNLINARNTDTSGQSYDITCL